MLSLPREFSAEEIARMCRELFAKDDGDALTALSESVRREYPKSKQTLVASLLARALAFDLAQQYPEELACYQQVLQLDAAHAEARKGKANALQKLKQCPDAVERSLSAASADVFARLAKSDELLSLLRFDEAVACWDQLIQADPSVEAYCGKALFLEGFADYDGAADCYTQALLLEPKNAAAFLGKGSAYCCKAEFLAELRDFEGALEYYEMALLHDPANARARNGRENIVAQFKPR